MATEIQNDKRRCVKLPDGRKLERVITLAKESRAKGEATKSTRVHTSPPFSFRIHQGIALPATNAVTQTSQVNYIQRSTIAIKGCYDLVNASTLSKLGAIDPLHCRPM